MIAAVNWKDNRSSDDGPGIPAYVRIVYAVWRDPTRRPARHANFAGVGAVTGKEKKFVVEAALNLAKIELKR
jgi:hypothetical protein